MDKMPRPTAQQLKVLLEKSGAELTGGLSAAEFDKIEEAFGFQFATDHRLMLSAALPVGKSWPDWRGGAKKLKQWLGMPAEGVLFDVENNGFWYEGWGPKPAKEGPALKTARWNLDKAPVMVPVFSHRFLPAGLDHHPVLSMMQTDIIVYGNDLADYLAREFSDAPGTPDINSTVEFWSDLVS